MLQALIEAGADLSYTTYAGENVISEVFKDNLTIDDPMKTEYQDSHEDHYRQSVAKYLILAGF